MANPPSGRSQQHSNDSNASNTLARSSQYTPGPQEKPPSRPSQLNDDKMIPGPRPSAEQSIQDVSPELIAAITERVKKELVEHLKQSANVESQQKTPAGDKAESLKKPAPARVEKPDMPAMQRESSNTSQASTSSSSKSARSPSPHGEHVKSPPRSPSEKLTGVRFSDRPLPRPGASRSGNVELSTIDQKWGRLFDMEGNPTQRLGQFLRGIANHIIEEFPTKKSIVITPSKMAAFYSSHALENEIHPLVSIFRAQSNEQISSLYQDLGCEHHLVQDHPSDPPTIPALTPVGFAHWMTIHILAYPDEEARRLKMVVISLPIDADGVTLDGKPERLPKQISRYLLPREEDRRSRKRIENAISDFFNDLGTSRRQKSAIKSSSPPRVSPSQSQTRPVEIHQIKTASAAVYAKPVERERSSYTSVSDSSRKEEPTKIERERQPYTAQPGSGKKYAEGTSFNASPRLGRANSTMEGKDRHEFPEHRHHRTQSTASQNHAPLPRPIRGPSSPKLSGYSSSTPDDLGGYQFVPSLNSAPSSFTSQPQPFAPSSLGSTGSFPPPPPLDRDRKLKDDRRPRRGTAGEARITAEFNSPRDAERWDRILDSRSAEIDGNGNNPTLPLDARDPKGASVEDWYRDGRTSGQARY